VENRLIEPTERQIQEPLVKLLRKFKYGVCVTSNRRHTSNTPGTPDVFVLVSNYWWIALEVKSRKGKVSKQQAALEHEGGSYVVRSVEEGFETVRRVTEALDNARVTSNSQSKDWINDGQTAQEVGSPTREIVQLHGLSLSV
jgi:hypothetical protein